ncbi:SDR family NAD(P)-dependent oxidoreductase, partial [Variovorax sp. GB1P17]|uniref:SDR family NAD(P)-dependent oxidoreductase n=1 Tax=Variovorax sp. GB1P17 TaxID=3443740 RepID=UPI003F45DB9F
MKTERLFDVSGSVVAITGAASGIGLGYAEVMAANGACVTLIDMNREALDQAVATLSATGGHVTGAVADVTQPDTLRAAFDDVVTRHGRLDTVFANAGISGGPGFLSGTGERNPEGEVENLSLDLWERVFATNVTSMLHTLQIVVPQMKKQGGGRIVVTSSVSASMPETLVSSMYATSKGAVAHMVRQYALELAKYGILLNAISPGPVITNIGGGVLKSEEVRRPFERVVPLGRIARPSDLQGAALFLASPASSLITGTEIIIDGGRVLGVAD